MCENLVEGRKEEEGLIFRNISSYVIKSFLTKEEKWQKMIKTDSLRFIILDWINNAQIRILIFTVNMAGALIPTTSLVKSTQTKSIYFIKKKPIAVTSDNFKNEILFGDFCPSRVSNVVVLIEEIFFPLLNNPLNHRTWPKVVIEDMTTQINQMRNTLAEIKGNISNKTILAVSMESHDTEKIKRDIEVLGVSSCNTNFKNTFEGMVIKWSSQINAALNETPLMSKKTLPINEIKYWNDRYLNLENIYKQLTGKQIKTVAFILEKLDSVYFQSFISIFKNVFIALRETKDISLWLNPLQNFTVPFDEVNFINSKPLVKPLIHVICLIYANSRYYRTKNRMTNLVKIVGNLLIARANDDLQPEPLFHSEPDEGLVKVQKTISVITYFKEQFIQYEKLLPTMGQQDFGNFIFMLQSNVLFENIDDFLKRLYQLKEIFSTAVCFQDLEKFEVGGYKGKVMSENIVEIHNEFFTLFRKWGNVKFDLLCESENMFLITKQHFDRDCELIEQKLSTILLKSFQEAHNIEQFYKLIQMCEKFLHRKIVQDKLKNIFNEASDIYSDELENILREMDCIKYYRHLMIERNFPPIADCFMQVHKLQNRITNMVEKSHFNIEFPIFDTEKINNLNEKAKVLQTDLISFSNNLLENWSNNLSYIEDALSEFVLQQNTSLKLLSLNIKENIECVIREVKYLQALGIKNIPEKACKLYEMQNLIWTRKIILSRIKDWYNSILTETEPSELSLINDEIECLNNEINTLCTSVSLNNYDNDLVESIYNKIKYLYYRMQRTKSNMTILLSTIKEWNQEYTFQRIASKKNFLSPQLLKYNSQDKQVSKCVVLKQLINKIMIENFYLFFDLPIQNESSSSGNDFFEIFCQENKVENEKYSTRLLNLYKIYQQYVDKLLGQEIVSSIQERLQQLKSDMDSQRCQLFIVKLVLQDNEIVFNPQFVLNQNEGFLNIIKQSIDNIIRPANTIPRLYTSVKYKQQNLKLQTFASFIADNTEICSISADIINSTEKAMKDAIKYATMYQRYSRLWLHDKSQALEIFLQENNIHENCNRSPQTLPPLEKFKAQIDQYNDLYDEIQKLETARTFGGWLTVDTRILKHEILNHITKWVNVYKEYLIGYVINSLKELDSFIDTAMKTLDTNVERENLDGLLRIMAITLQIHERENHADCIFKTIREIVSLLKYYSVEFEDRIHCQINVLPERWATLKNISKQKNIQLHSNRFLYFKNNFLNTVLYLSCRIQSYRSHFNKMSFFRVPCNGVYNMCDKVFEELQELQNSINEFNLSARLFEIDPPADDILKLCFKEIKEIKQLWDLLYVIESCIKEWKATPWKRIDVENMENECKKFTKDLRALNNNVRSWEPYTYIDGLLKNLVTSIRTITELQNPALTDRHWIELMKTTKLSNIFSIKCLMRFKNDPTTALSELLSLKLNHFEEDVKNTVDKAMKEMAMSKILLDIEKTWQKLEFQFENLDRRQTRLLKASEELVETLENNQMQLQNIVSSKYIDFLLNNVIAWQKKLSMVDKILNIIFELQRKWIHLESIFIGSADIRAQLPDESRRFEETDNDFMELLNLLPNFQRILDIIESPNILNRLESITKRLILCERALNHYLESKRYAFPRFYFLSSCDLLDILSNSNKPRLMSKHFIKLFDSIQDLKFKENSTLAEGMMSKEHDEYVIFNGVCDCSGKVEVWLGRVINTMQNTLRDLFKRSLEDSKNKPREQWLMNWPAQTALCCSQVLWSFDVNASFVAQSEGYESAMKDYQRKQIAQLNSLIGMLLGDLLPGDRQKIMTICTIDVHSRDVVAKIIQQKIENAMAFQWQSQLRHRWDDHNNDCYANICDAEFLYAYEYLGNTSRLVITPLTDRCYITLTQSLRLVMGGAPAGPAGTGKTETTKDLGRALGVMVYVFNCSEQMDYKSCENIYKGLAQTGAWGCFDEFNRISVEVLSVVAVHVKTIQDAIRAKKTNFTFMGCNIKLVPTVGIFITMNPGYAGRTELPENLKALFRPCAMVVPDFVLICEIMLMAEGFQEARILGRKFITLYTLCKELLSKQDHYDWGLRAIKSVLVVAGSLKREDRTRSEDQVLMRALRDFNMSKIVTQDVAIFMGLIGDLFPALDVPRKRQPEFERLVRISATSIKLQPQESFVLKVVQLQELLDVRHSVFIVGNAGTGKTRIWQTLLQTYQNQGLKPYYNVLNPKAVTNDELFGYINPTTREWKDGLFSTIMRDQANMSGSNPKWIVLDGDIDPLWIESLNTLMDDNKILTLASNERISLKKDMRLLFEVGHLQAATPATVSRAGILYVNPQDLGWNTLISSWLETRNCPFERSVLSSLFEKYIPRLLKSSKKFKKVTPISDVAMIEMTCNLIDSVIDLILPKSEPTKQLYEMIFMFAAIWGFGSGLFQDHLVDWRKEFHKWWIMEFKDSKLPTKGLVFDYYIDGETSEYLPWTNRVENFQMDPEIPLQNTLVPTSETTRLTFFLNLLIKRKEAVLLIGNSGSGKNAIFKNLFQSYSEDIQIENTHLNFYTTSDMFQKILDKRLEKRNGRCYCPSGNKSLIYFISDLNMPEVDAYGTVQPHTIIRQYMDYRQWYDRNKLILKQISDRCQFAACMNPTTGSFTIDPRLQRHFHTFAVNYPTENILNHIYFSILSQHLDNPYNSFNKETRSIAKVLVAASVALHRRIEYTFLPTAIKFHYIFNLRDMTNIFQGLLLSNGTTCNKPLDLIRMYIHEATRVYHDKLIDENDIKSFKTILKDVFKKELEDFDEDYLFTEPILYSHFAQSLFDQKYLPIKSWKSLHTILLEAQKNYNELIGCMNIVMFEDAMLHICRINRILDSPRGNALLIGVGGSGKQTLASLAAFISGLSLSQIDLKRGYTLADMKEDFAGLYTKVGLKNIGSILLLTDAHISDETFLVLINDMLASGEIPELFSEDNLENIINGVRNEVKQSGMLDTKDNCWKFFIEKVRKMLKIVLCFSPVGPTLRIRARKFPAIINGTSIDWFHDWPTEALESVSKQFLLDIEILPVQVIDPLSHYMAYVHETVGQTSIMYLNNEKRYNYTTPKTFLEFISLFTKLFIKKTMESTNRIERLENGMSKLTECSKQVDLLREQLAIQEIALKAKNQAADKLIIMVSAENDKVKKEKLAASEEEKRVRIIEEDVSIKAKMCEEDLRKAEPALVAAQAALNTLNKNNLTELKSFGSPPKAVANVCAAVMVLLAANGKIPKDRSWRAAKLMMVKVDQFLSDLVNYDKDNIHSNIIEALQDYLQDPEFNPDNIVQKSVAAAGLCAWVINLHKYHEVFMIVGPKQQALQDAQNELCEARERLNFLKNKINEFEKKLHVIQTEYENALAEKQKCQSEADQTAFTIDLAHRLVDGLSKENLRWKESVASLREQISTLPGDILLISCFLSYVGCFTRSYRTQLVEKMWYPTFKKIEPSIPHSLGIDPLHIIADDAQIAIWNNEGLPTDRISTENATIFTYSSRWPLLIDPQLQCLRWIKNKFGKDLVILQLTQKGYLEIIERAMAYGSPLLIENIQENLDSILNPLLSRAFIKKGRCLKLGDREMDVHPDFKLILHTKLANPHYKPEIQAQTTIINFTVTRDGLEDQLLGEVVKAERPDLEKMKTEVTIQQNHFKITLKDLEDELLSRLNSAGKDVLKNSELVLNLEKTKRTVIEIETKVTEAKSTAIQIDETREKYRSVSKRAAILYFVLNDLYKINPIYQFSLKAFRIVFKRSISLAPLHNDPMERVAGLINSITYQTFLYTLRGLFERDKLIFTAQMTFQILIYANLVSAEEIDYLLRFPHDPNILSPVNFISNTSWAGIRTLAMVENFYHIDKDIIEYQKRWRKFIESDFPEREHLPGEWKSRTPLQRLCIIRALRPDRMIYAMRHFIEKIMGSSYIEVTPIPFQQSFEESSSTTPIFFILSPGIDPLIDVEKLGEILNFNIENENFHNISLGQGQEILAETAIKIASEKGHWVILQNIHLVAKWLPSLETLMESIAENAHDKFRLFISAEQAHHSECHVIPQEILESSIKIVNEPPSGLAANMHKALQNFNQETLEICTQEAEFKTVLFTLCYFHAVVSERRKFGAQGWNKNYPFNFGDLTISASVLYNYLEGKNRVPWEDLRYLFGEIMYGGHITDDWDRKLCNTYLEEFLQQELVDGDFYLCEGFPTPPNLNYESYHEYIDRALPPESPILYGLHQNAEIGFLTASSDTLLKTVFELQPKESELNTISGPSRDELVKIIVDDLVDKLQEEFNLAGMGTKVELKTPFIIVVLQECERMNLLMQEIKRSLKEFSLGLKGELTITSEMEKLEGSLFYDHVPHTWEKLAYPTQFGLQSWFADLLQRARELSLWSSDFFLPRSVWIGGLFNPQSFLTAVMQQTARKNEWPLDKMFLICEVTKTTKDDIRAPIQDKIFVHGLYLEGASWDCKSNSITSLKPNELYSLMPVIQIKATICGKQEQAQIYQCPIYKTRERGLTYVWTFNLRTLQKPSKWILGGVALLLQP